MIGSLFLVTGGCGFIGSHLCEALLDQGHRIRVLDDLSTGRPENLAAGASLVHGSTEDPACVDRALEGVDGCFHLAAVASVERGRREWLHTHRANATGLVTLFDAIARRAPIPVVYASSAAVYGDCSDLPIREQAACVPLSAYGADKVACELHARVAARLHDIPTTGLRFFNVYGPRQEPRSPYSGVISIFADRIGRGLPLDINGDGEQTRDFIHVDDVVTALVRAMRCRIPDGPVYNVCTGAPCSILALARLLGRVLGERPALRFRPTRVGDIRGSVGDPSLGRTALDLPAPTPLPQGLRAMLLPAATLTRAPAARAPGPARVPPRAAGQADA